MLKFVIWVFALNVRNFSNFYYRKSSDPFYRLVGYYNGGII